MNLVDVSISEIIEPPRQVVNEEFCGWVVKVATDCYGCRGYRTFTATTKEKIQKYRVGYTWRE